MTNKERTIVGILQDPLLCFESPMEKLLYDEFKTFGLTPKLQYKVGRYFLDFAFPEAKIGIEYDGQVHIGRELYDEKRDEELNFKGWEIFRLTKFDMHLAFDEITGEYQRFRLYSFMDSLRDRLFPFRRKNRGFASLGDVLIEIVGNGYIIDKNYSGNKLLT